MEVVRRVPTYFRTRQILHLLTCVFYLGWAGGSPIVRRDRYRSGDPGATCQAFVIAGMLGPQNLAFLLSHRREILDTFHNLHTAEPAECDAVTRLTKPEPGLQHRIQETCFVNDSHLAARRLELNGCHLDVEFRKLHSRFRSAAVRSSSSRKSGWEMSIRLRALSLMLRPKRLAMPYSVTTK